MPLFIAYIIQSITEFLPISSSAHLELLSCFGLPAISKMQALILHFATLFTLFIFYHQKILSLIKGLIQFKKTDLIYIRNMVIATPCALLMGYLMLYIPIYFSPGFIAFNLFFWGVILIACDLFPQNKSITSLKAWQAAVIGLMQCLALFPGVSRLGITLSTMRFFKIKRLEAAQFSFMLSIPLIMAGSFYGFYKMPNLHFATLPFLVALPLGLITLYAFTHFIKKHSLILFGIYRIILAFILIFI